MLQCCDAWAGVCLGGRVRVLVCRVRWKLGGGRKFNLDLDGQPVFRDGGAKCCGWLLGPATARCVSRAWGRSRAVWTSPHPTSCASSTEPEGHHPRWMAVSATRNPTDHGTSTWPVSAPQAVLPVPDTAKYARYGKFCVFNFKKLPLVCPSLSDSPSWQRLPLVNWWVSVNFRRLSCHATA